MQGRMRLFCVHSTKKTETFGIQMIPCLRETYDD